MRVLCRCEEVLAVACFEDQPTLCPHPALPFLAQVGNTSSKFYPDVSSIRTSGSFLYEEFLMTQGTDIKIYVAGPDYAHAEARKSPVVDGIVNRDEEGKEVR